MSAASLPQGARRPSAPSSAPARRARVTAALAAVALALAGCTQIPQSSAVRSNPALEGPSPAVDAPQIRPPGPSEDATEEEIVRGFLAAGTGPQDDYAVAREYLAGDAVDDWQPGRRTVVYAAEPTLVHTPRAGGWQVQVEVESEIDAAGIRTIAPPGTTLAWDVTVRDVDGRWRITDVDDGLLLSRAQFSQSHTPHRLAFYDQSMTRLIPDVRWFANRGNGTVTSVVNALLAGPAPYLTGAVATAFPVRGAGALTGPSVPVSTDGVARVDLTEGTVEGADAARLHRMEEQIVSSLDDLVPEDRIEVTVAGRSITVDGADVPASAEAGMSSGGVQVAVDAATGGLVYFQGLSVTPVGGLPALGVPVPVDPAMSLDRTGFAYLDSSRTTLRTARTDGTTREVLQGSALTAPSVDSQGWVWTVDRGAGSRISAAPLESERPRVVTTPWLREAQRIVALRIGPGGARAALILEEDGRRSLQVSGVVRGSDGVPSALTEPVLLSTATEPDEVRWAGTTSLLVSELAEDPEDSVRPEVVSLEGAGRVLNPLDGIVGISAGDDGALYAETADGVSLLVGSSWRAQELPRQIRGIAFPG